MNHCVPDFDIEMDDDEYPIPSSSGLACAKKASMQGDEIMELLWQNGQVVMQSQNHRSPRKPTPASYTADAVIPAGPSTTREVRPSQQPEVESYQTQHLFMQEDEMTSWLHYPIVDDSPLDHNFCADLLYLPPTANNNINNNNNTNSSVQNPARTAQKAEFRLPTRTVVAPRPPIPPARRTEPVQTKIQNFAHFSKRNARVEPGPSSSKNVIKESTVVDSSDTPAVAAVSRISETVRNSAEPADIEAGKGSMSTAGVAAPSTTSAAAGTGGREMMTCEMTVTSSPGGSSASAEPAPAEDRKRKGREPEDSECQSEDVDLESADVRKQARGSTSNKRSRAAEVHNLSERKRRDRINEKMRALQELIPRCNKSDKASMLDEAIEYLKSLQLQVQMMSMGCGMVPMMFPGIQQYMAAAPMGMGIGMGMGMGMEMGMNRPVMPFPNMLGGSALPAATAAAAYLGPRFPVPPFHMPPNVPHAPDSSRMQPANQADPPMLNSPGASDPNQLPIPNIGDPYQQYLGPHQMQFQVMQNQATNQPNFSKPSSSKDNEKPDNHKSEGT